MTYQLTDEQREILRAFADMTPEQHRQAWVAPRTYGNASARRMAYEAFFAWYDGLSIEDRILIQLRLRQSPGEPHDPPPET